MAKICFIVGHGKSASGGYDSGAVSGGYHEFRIAKEIAKHAAEYFNKTYTDTADLMNYNGDLYLTERIEKVNANQYDFIAEIHLNAGGGTGVETYYYHNSRKAQTYADKICDYIADALDLKQRANYGDDRAFDTDKDGGDKTKLGKSGKDYFGIIRDTKPCAVLIETVFIDTASDLNKVKTAEGQKKCGEAIAKAVAEVRGLKKKTASAENTEAETAQTETFKPYLVRVNAKSLNVRGKPGTNGKIQTTVKKGTAFTIVDEDNGWGLLKSYADKRNGWVSLNYTEKV